MENVAIILMAFSVVSYIAARPLSIIIESAQWFLTTPKFIRDMEK